MSMLEFTKGLTIKPRGWFSDLLDGYLKDKATAGVQMDRKRIIRPSEIGSCERRIVMLLLNLIKAKPVTPQQQRVFDMGNAVHKRYLKSYIPALGVAAMINGKPFIEQQIQVPELWLKGAPDAVIINADDNLPYIFELKSIKQELFNELTEPSNDYIMQVHLYMFMCQIDRAIVFYENKNNQDTKEFFIMKDENKMKEVLDKVRSIQKYVSEWSEEHDVLPPRCGNKTCEACK